VLIIAALLLADILIGLVLATACTPGATPYPTTHPTVTTSPTGGGFGPREPTSESPIETPTPHPSNLPTFQSSTLPAVYRCACNCLPTPGPTPTPAPGTPEIHNCSGAITSTAWLTATFGAVSWTSSPTAHVERILPCCGDCPAVLVAHVEDPDGRPLGNVTVVLHWPDAPILPLELRACGLDRGVYGPTNANGDIGFGLGGGAYYWPPGGGPHTIWIPTDDGGPCLFGLGMLGGTNHAHLDSGWSLEAGADSAALRDWGYTPGTLIRRELIAGRYLNVIYWPRPPKTPEP
jgi:hypothetical protein